MAFNITSGMIEANMLYQVSGSISYNSETYTNQNFRGVADVTNFSGAGIVIEVTEFTGGTVLFVQDHDKGYKFPDPPVTMLGAAINFQQDSQDTIFNEVTKIEGMSVTFADFPFYQIDIMEQKG
ncbi:hypothetical protein HDF24_24090 [Mucilaginibacter sp. X4EP1]|jgi:hypothetical protein|uniref:hypothetical protein n=1 Tax=Mucilaginibacter sp. X4EP1 TaxID=2723092 RepID=UPI0021688216|nr:hypothetical protein [Mucilaginibacter sp. X4EP1]MCS3816175.1 hypothetical protein [Mucilaginibacter sp. X4EP1]